METQLIARRKTKSIMIGKVGIGAEFPVSIQSMTNTNTSDTGSTLRQIRQLAALGCEIIRVAVPDHETALSLGLLVKKSPLPVIADIHFDYQLALAAIGQGIHGLRLNPGNIGAKWKVKEVVVAAKERQIPIRIGVNSGSLEKEFLSEYGGVCAEAMVASAMRHVALLEDLNYDLIKISLKASHVPLMIAAYQKIAETVAYPLHLGVTEAGLPENGSIKSAVGIGALLAQGIGDTIRVSLTGDPVPEIKTAQVILRTLGLRHNGVEIIACPTCGRCCLDLASLAAKIEQKTAKITLPLKIAIMGCAVNGPGEAREADVGIAGGKGEGLVFVKGAVIRKVPEEDLMDALLEEVNKLIKKNK